MEKRSLTGKQQLGAIGLGAMGMSDLYGSADRTESIKTIHAALDSGINIIDTGDFYGSGANELLIGEAVRDRRDDAFIAVKFGALRSPDGGWVGIDTRPAALKNFLAMTLKRLGVDHIDLYQPARIDPNVPIEETVGAIQEMVQAGYVRHIGLSEAGSETIRRAHATAPISAVQTEYSLFSRTVEDDILPTLRELGISLSAYGVLSRGLLSGKWTAERMLAPGDFRGRAPRFAGEALQHNLKLVEGLKAFADEKGVSVASLALKWVLAQGDDIFPLFGARRTDQLADALASMTFDLTPDDLEKIEALIPRDAVSGTRYASYEMGMLDSERGR